MKKLFSVTAIFCLFLSAFAQDEELTPLTINPGLYHTTKTQQPGHSHRYLVQDGYYVVFGDTLHLPFVDDFSSNHLGTLNWNQNHITDTFYNVTGTCLAIEGVTLTEGHFMTSPSWSYSYDITNHRIDSVANDSVMLTLFAPAASTCFSQPPSPLKRWNTYYTYTFDTVTGHAIDSTLVQPSDTFFYAPIIYFVQGEPGTLWTDNYAWVNNTYPINPPTVGVATLDGLNQYGLPYNNSNNHTHGTADYLTSKPIDLSTLGSGDSIYLSFFVEPQGLGDYPDIDDSLILEFKDNNNGWRQMWFDSGFASLSGVTQKFSQVLVQVPALAFPFTYYYNAFQFRFRNEASLYGNNDHWHIDYVKLDKNRFAADTVIHDIAFVYPFPALLKNFSLMPADQVDIPGDLRDTILLTIHNLDPDAVNNPPATNFVKNASEVYPTPVVIAPDVLQTFNAAEYSFISINPPAEYNIPNTPNWPVDSLVINSGIYIQPNDSRAQNDTLYHTQRFDNTLAYDDGTAERSYGITGLGLKKFAYEFNLNHPDTLVAFQIQFSQVEEDVSNLIFNYYIWDSLKMYDYLFNDTIGQIFSLENKKPFYIDSMNGFATYKLDEPLMVSGKIYFGWAQTDTRRLQVGYDLNSKLGRPHMYIFSNTTWKPSSVSPDGSPMIRLIFDSNYWGQTSTHSGINQVTEDENNISVYPNPTNGILNIRSERPNVLFEATVHNMLGETVKQEQGISDHLDIYTLQAGVYLLTLRDTQSGKLFRHKLIKTAM